MKTKEVITAVLAAYFLSAVCPTSAVKAQAKAKAKAKAKGSLGGAGESSEDLELSIDDPASLAQEPAQHPVTKPAAAPAGSATKFVQTQTHSDVDTREAKFEQWVEDSKKEQSTEDEKVTLDNEAFLAVRGSLTRRNRKVDALEKKLAHAIKWGKDTQELMQKTVAEDKAHERQIEAERVREKEAVREQAEFEQTGLKQQLYNSSKEVEAEKQIIDRLGSDLMSSRKQLEALQVAAQTAETQYQTKLEEKADEIANKEDTISYLKSAKANEDSQLNNTLSKNRQIFMVARNTIQKVRAAEKNAKKQLQKEKDAQRSREDSFRKEIATKDRELQESHLREVKLEKQLKELEALATRTGDAAAKFLGVHGVPKKAARHSHAAVATDTQAGAEGAQDLADALEGTGEEQAASADGGADGQGEEAPTPHTKGGAHRAKKPVKAKAHQKSTGGAKRTFLDVSQDDDSSASASDPNPEDLVAISLD